MVNPIFILGLPRNGTTWIMNSLTKNDNIVTPQHWLHYGAHEANFSKINRSFGSFKTYDQYIDFIGSWSLDDFFILARGDVDDFIEKPRTDYIDLFLDLMDNFAIKNDTKFWVIKMDPDLYWNGDLFNFWERVKSRYTNPKVISILRKDSDAVRSYISMEGPLSQRRAKHASLATLLGFARQVYGRSVITDFVKKEGGFHIDYEELRFSQREMEKQVDQYLGVNGSLGTNLDDQYFRNSSFNRSDGPETVGALNSIISRIASNPLIAKMTINVCERTKNRRTLFTHRILKYEYNPDALVSELKQNRSEALLEKLREYR